MLDPRQFKKAKVVRRRGPGGNFKKAVISDSAAVHPDDAPYAEEHASKCGVPTPFTRDGQPVFSSEAHQRRYAKAYGFRQRNSSY